VSSAGLDASFTVRRSERFTLRIRLSVPPGRTVALLGPNGAGKSTAVEAIAGLIPVDDGHIELAGVLLDCPRQGVFVPPERRRVGVVFQDYLLFPHLSVIENVAFGPRSRKMGRRAALARAREWIERLDLGGLEHRKPRELSGGQAQRVAIARALVSGPRIVFADEPTGSLDSLAGEQVMNHLTAAARSEGVTVVLVTHEPRVAAYADREIVVRDGRISGSERAAR
jgi:molybdate transport system ATP-binding protein